MISNDSLSAFIAAAIKESCSNHKAGTSQSSVIILFPAMHFAAATAMNVGLAVTLDVDRNCQSYSSGSTPPSDELRPIASGQTNISAQAPSKETDSG